ncbi:MAG TPA: enolase C-terminal domain-like protein [Vicinamibacterales bacterium]|nr:enolase C-terminal domain-like protein [Vicinamibacterales bacterium]
MTRAAGTPIERVTAAVYVVPTDAPESDGTFTWDATTMVIVEATAGGSAGIGYTYASDAAAAFVRSPLATAVTGLDAFDLNAAWTAMTVALRNNGRPGIASSALSAVDAALWDLKGRLTGLSVVSLLGAARDSVPVYGSGGFTSYTIERLQAQLGGWVAEGIGRVKMKIGRHPRDDIARVRAARAAIGDAELFVDANGAYTRKQALSQAEAFAGQGVCWFEEPVSSDDLEGLALLVDRLPPGMAVAAGEYGYDAYYFRRMLQARAVDVLQADATRCGGITGFLKAAALCEAWNAPLSAHTAPSIHAHVCAAIAGVQHIEYFHDHARIEQMFFDGAARPSNGALRPDRARPGLGLELKRADAERFRHE